MQKVMFLLAAVVLSVALYAISVDRVGSAQAPTCERRACRSGDKYSRRNHRCESGPNWLGYRSHYAASCPDGFNLDEAKGVCVKPGECCDKPACKPGFRMNNGRCERGPTGFGGYMSHYSPECEAGWDLIASQGICRKRDCGGGSESQGAGPQIDRLGPTPCVDRGGTAIIYGSGFGGEQGDRVVELGGHGIGIFLQVTSWTDTEIHVVVPNDNRIQFSQWYYIGLQNADHHWISNISRNITICRQFG